MNADDIYKALYNPYKRGWRIIRRVAIKLANNKCVIGPDTPWGRCSSSERLHVHHVHRYSLYKLYPILSYSRIQKKYHDADLLAAWAYHLAWEKKEQELEEYLKRSPELYPVLCYHHHALFGYHDTELLRFLIKYRPHRYSTITKGRYER